MDEKRAIGDLLMRFALSMSARYGGPPDNWLDKPLVELVRWAEIAAEMIEEEKELMNRQPLRPGL